MDCKDLKFSEGTFEAVIDKACLDAILCGDKGTEECEKVLQEIHRVLSPTGIYICISYGVPESRLKYFNKKEFDWTVFTHKISKPTISTSTVATTSSKQNEDNSNFHFMYVMWK